MGPAPLRALRLEHASAIPAATAASSPVTPFDDLLETSSLLQGFLLRVVDAPLSGLYARPVRFLLANNHCISDPTAGVTQSLRAIMEWLADAGHACHILTTARFESSVTFTIEEHLTAQGLDMARLAPPHGPSK